MVASRALNGERHVSEASRAKVLEASAALGYQPSIFARGLVSNRSFMICMLIPEVIPGYIADFQLGATERCRASGHHLIALPYDSREGRYSEAVRDCVATLRPDGFIVTPPISDDLAVLDVLDDFGSPYVRLSPGRQGERGSSIAIDEAAAAQAVMALLLQRGHRRIGFIKAHPDHLAAAARYDGYRNALAAHGLQVEPELVCQGDFDFTGGESCASRLLDLKARPTAVFASNDDTALGVMAAARRRGLSIPKDLSVVGFDDSELARHAWPGLTTLRQPIRQMAAEAVDLLIRREASVHSVVDFEVIERGSVAAASA